MSNLTEMFGLQSEVDAFVKRRVRDMATERHDFSMAGSPHQCSNHEPHPPHSVGGYSTVRNGWGEYMCDGVPGRTPEGELVIIFERRSNGSAYDFSSRKGYWFIKKEE